MTRNLNPEHEKVARTAWQKIHDSIERHDRLVKVRDYIGGWVLTASDALDALGPEHTVIEEEKQ